MRMQSLQDELGKPYRGVLVADPQRRFRYHVFSSSEGHGKDMDTMGKGDQSQLVYLWAMGDSVAKLSGVGAKSWARGDLKGHAYMYMRSTAHRDGIGHGDATCAIASNDDMTRASPLDYDGHLMECDVVSYVIVALDASKRRTTNLVNGDTGIRS